MQSKMTPQMKNSMRFAANDDDDVDYDYDDTVINIMYRKIITLCPPCLLLLRIFHNCHNLSICH